MGFSPIALILLLARYVWICAFLRKKTGLNFFSVTVTAYAHILQIKD